MTREEMMFKAKDAKSAEELIALAKENNVEVSEEEIRAYYESIHTTGELADDELDNVAGGRCYNDGRPVVGPLDINRDCYECRCGARGDHDCSITNSYTTTVAVCCECKWFVYEKGLCLCDNPAKRK